MTGFHYNFVSTSTRILVISLFVTTIIVYTYYTSFLVATFAVIKIKMPFTDLQGVYTKRNDYHLGILGDSSLSDLLRVRNLSLNYFYYLVMIITMQIHCSQAIRDIFPD